MKRKRLKIVIYIVGFLLFLFLILICYWSIIINDPAYYVSPKTISSESGYSLYNPETVLSSIEKEKTDVFIDTETNPEEEPLENNSDFHVFTDEELFSIAQYYMRMQWEEDPNDWRLTEIAYYLEDCGKGFDGPYSVGYFFEKKIRIENNKYIDVRSINIDVWKSSITWNDKVEDRKKLSTVINWEDIKFNGMEVYKIAEENGGYEIHSGSENQCDYVLMYLFANNTGWNINYYEDLKPKLFDIEIDARTGKIIE